ncbi:MAG: hypothetical protein CMF71_02025 [Magnetovibrio sp.]|nr:hypothetical protein [Magnetovibrio sp.]
MLIWHLNRLGDDPLLLDFFEELARNIINYEQSFLTNIHYREVNTKDLEIIVNLTKIDLIEIWNCLF